MMQRFWLPLLLWAAVTSLAACATGRGAFADATKLATAGEAERSPAFAVPTSVAVDSAGFWRVEPKRSDDRLERRPDTGALITAKRAEAQRPSHLFEVVDTSAKRVRLRRLTTGRVDESRGPWRLERWSPVDQGKLTLDSGRRICIGRGAVASSDCLKRAPAATRWWVFDVAIDRSTPPEIRASAAPPALAHRRADALHPEGSPVDLFPTSATSSERWLAVPAPVGPPAIPQVRAARGPDCPTDAFEHVGSVETLSSAQAESLPNLEPLQVSNLSVALGVDVLVACPGSRAVVATPVMFRRLHHTRGIMDHPWWIGLEPLRWPVENHRRLGNLVHAIALMAAGDPVAAEARLARTSPTSRRSEALLWARLAGAASVAGRPETGLRRMTIAARHAWRPQSNADMTLARADALSAFGWTRRASEQLREARDLATDALAQRVGWFSSWADLRGRWVRTGQVRLAANRQRELADADRHRQALAVRMLSVLGGRRGGEARDDDIAEIHNEASRRGLAALARAISGDLDPLTCAGDACTPDAYARRRPRSRSTVTLGDLARTPFSILRTTPWNHYLPDSPAPGSRAHAAVLRERLPWSVRHDTASTRAIAHLLRDASECVDLPVFASPDRWFNTPATDRHVRTALQLINDGCQSPVAAASRLARVLDDAPHMPRLGLLADSAFVYLARRAPSNAVARIVTQARQSFDDTSYPACAEWQLFEAALHIHQRQWPEVEDRFTGVLNCSSGSDEQLETFVQTLGTYVDVQRGRTTPSSVGDAVAVAAVFGERGMPAGADCAGARLVRPSPVSLLPDWMASLWPHDAVTTFDPTTYADSARSQDSPLLEMSNRSTSVAAGLTALGRARQHFGNASPEAGLRALRRAHRNFLEAAYVPGLARARFALTALGFPQTPPAPAGNAPADNAEDAASDKSSASSGPADQATSSWPEPTCSASQAGSADRRLRCYLVRGVDDAPATSSDVTDLCMKSGLDQAFIKWVRTGQLTAAQGNAKTNCEYRTDLCGWNISY